MICLLFLSIFFPIFWVWFSPICCTLTLFEVSSSSGAYYYHIPYYFLMIYLKDPLYFLCFPAFLPFLDFSISFFLISSKFIGQWFIVPIFLAPKNSYFPSVYDLYYRIFQNTWPRWLTQGTQRYKYTNWQMVFCCVYIYIYIFYIHKVLVVFLNL